MKRLEEGMVRGGTIKTRLELPKEWSRGSLVQTWGENLKKGTQRSMELLKKGVQKSIEGRTEKSSEN